MTSIQLHPVPRGWRRVVTVDAVYYVSPDKRVLWNRSDVLKHLTSWGTCKCGLQCPVDIDLVFSFNQSVPTGHELPAPTGSCTHVRNADTDANNSHNLDNVASCDPQGVNRKPDECQEMDSNYVDDADHIITQDLDKNDPPGAIVSLFETPFHDTGQPELQSVQEQEFDNTLQYKIKNTKSSSSPSLSDNAQTAILGDVSLSDTIEPNTTVLNTSLQEPQVSDVIVKDKLSEDNLLAKGDTQANAEVLSILQEEQAGGVNQPADHKAENVDLLLIEETSSPVVELCKQQEPLSPQTSPLLSESVCHQASPSLQSHSLVDIMSLSPRDFGEPVPVCRAMPRRQLVDYGYDADSDSADEDDAPMESNPLACNATIQIKPAIVDCKFTDDSTDSISDDSDSNYLVRESCGRKFTAITVRTDSNYLTQNLSDTGTCTGTGSCDEKVEVHGDVKVLLSPTTALLSPPLPCMKPVEQNSPISPEDDIDMVPSITDDSVSASLVEDEPKFHAMETPLCTSTASAVAIPSVATKVTTSFLQVHVPHLSTSVTSPVFNLSTKSVYPVNNDTANITAVVSSAGSDGLLSLSVKTACNETSRPPVTTFENIPSFCKNAFEDGTDFNAESSNIPANTLSGYESDDTEPSVNFATGFVISPVLKTAHSALLPVSIACSEVSVFASPTAIPKTCPSPVSFSIPTSDSVPSTSTPVLILQMHSSNPPVITSVVCSNTPVTTVTQTSSRISTTEAIHLLDTNTTTDTSTVTSDKNDNNRDLISAQTFDNCQINKQESTVPESNSDKIDDDIPVSTFPAALKLSIDLAVLPQKKKVVQKAKWAALLTTPVPVLRERKKSQRTTVTVESTIIKSDRKPTTKSIPKKQLQLSPVNNQYNVGDVLWSKFSYWDLWPCKIILHSDVDQLEPSSDQVWVEWFGDHSYSKVDRGSLKSYKEGLQQHLSSKKRKQARKLKKAVAEVRSLVEGISTTKGSSKKKKQMVEAQRDNYSVGKQGCPS